MYAIRSYYVRRRRRREVEFTARLNDLAPFAVPLSARRGFRAVAVRLDLDASLAPVTADYHRTRQMLLNLALNAAQALPGGRITSYNVCYTKLLRAPVGNDAPAKDIWVPRDQAPPRDHSVWPDSKPPIDQHVHDTYSGFPFGCDNDIECMGRICCTTPWGVKMCADTCPW